MASYTTTYNEDLFAVVNKTITDLNATYVFLVNNSLFKTNFVPTNQVATFTKVNPTPSQVVSNKPASPVIAKSFISQNNQSVFDICLMTLTDLNQVYQLNFISLNTPPKAQSEFIYNPQNITDNILSKYISENNVIFNTSNN